ncbi:uncharacterized protein BDW70DRAFT_32987 [Aspergillus foveolatus]|uniref:uncharacterized protein n=1 Tax=Aspergillus foveolatus TaxID=210207 RepID=UPI003CCC9977
MRKVPASSQETVLKDPIVYSAMGDATLTAVNCTQSPGKAKQGILTGAILHHAVSRNQPSLMKASLSLGAHPHTRDAFGRSPLSYTVETTMAKHLSSC